MRLIADIGGTNVRMALVDENKNITNSVKYLRSNFKNVTEVIKFYLNTISGKPTEAIIAVNTLVVNNAPHIGTNPWGYNSPTLKQDTGIENFTFLNDLVAHSLSVPYMNKTTLYQGFPIENGNIIVVGPGTGLGICYGLFNKSKNKYDFFPTEAGSQLICAADEKQIEILAKLLKTFHEVTVEDIVSGRGISNVHEVLFGEKKSAEEIMRGKSREAFNIFCEFLGVAVRNAATIFLANGGIYFVGGILSRPENIELLKASKFMDYYNFTMPNLDPHIAEYPIYIISDDTTGLEGLANY